MSDLYRKVGTSTPDNLITGLNPPVDVVMITALKQAAETTLTRGTVLAVISGGTNAGKAVILGTTAGTGETLTPSYILAEDVVIGTAADVQVVAYRSGCFSPAHVTVKTGYTITAADIDNLRMRNIVFQAYNA
jgi:hypothetical protein